MITWILRQDLRDVWRLLALVASIAVPAWLGIGAGLILAAAVFLSELIPLREKHEHRDGTGTAKSIQWCFHGSWLALQMSIVFGLWVCVPSARAWLWLALLYPVMVAATLITNSLPIISFRFLRIRTSDASWRFRIGGNWWGDETRFLWLSDKHLLIASETECGWRHHVLDLQSAPCTKTLWLGDASMTGPHPSARKLPHSPEHEHRAQTVEHLLATCGAKSNAALRDGLNAFLDRTPTRFPAPRPTPAPASA